MDNYYKSDLAKLANYYMTQGAMRILEHISSNGELIDRLHKCGDSDKRILVSTLINEIDTIY